ncbi:MAG: hypothetical protein WCQ32_00090 [bacterium]
MEKFFHTTKEKGNVMIITTLLFVAITLSISFGLILPVLGAYGNSKSDIQSKASYALAESGVEDAYYRVMNNKNVSSTNTLVLGNATATTTVTDISSTQKQIKSIGALSNFNRISTATVAKAATVNLFYGAIVGTGGLSMQNGQAIYGGVYANGPITGSNSSVTISGAAISTTSIIGDDQWRPFNVGTSGTYDAWAPIVSKTNATGKIYCTTGSLNNKVCDTSRGTPSPQTMPIPDALIADWKTKASGNVINGNVNYAGTSGTVTISSRKIVGNLNIDNGYTVKLTGPIWVTGNFTMGNGKLQVDPSYAGGSIALLVDGYTSVGNGATITGSGVAGSYAIIVDTSDCPTSGFCGGNPAISVNGGGGSIALIAQNGTLVINSCTGVQQATAKTVQLLGGVSITYNSGLSTLTFSSTGGWGVSSWQETTN